MKTIFFICSALLFFGCNSGKKTTATSDSLQMISQGNLHGAGSEGIEAQQRVITSEQEWNALLKKMNSVNPISENFKIKEIDFSKEAVLVLFESVKTTGGHSVGVSGIRETDENIVVKVQKTAPEGMATTVMTQPYYLAKIKKPSKPVVFE